MKRIVVFIGLVTIAAGVVAFVPYLVALYLIQKLEISGDPNAVAIWLFGVIALLIIATSFCGSVLALSFLITKNWELSKKLTE